MLSVVLLKLVTSRTEEYINDLKWRVQLGNTMRHNDGFCGVSKVHSSIHNGGLITLVLLRKHTAAGGGVMLIRSDNSFL